MSSKEHTLWVEKYRSPNLDSYVGNEQIKNTISKYLGQNDIQNFIFYGPAGTGKTTLAKLIVNNLDCSFLYINASDERGIDTIRDKVQGFSSVASFKPLKVVILDEADFLTIKNENVGMGADDLKLVVNQYYPDIRKMLNTLQMGVAGDEILIDKNILVSSNYKTKVLAELIKPNSKSFNNIRQIVADSGVSDYEDLFRYLYDNVEKYAPLSVGEVIIYIEEYQYHANFRIDKEINIMALISRILLLISSKRVI